MPEQDTTFTTSSPAVEEPVLLIVDDEQDFTRGLSRLIQGDFPELRIHTADSGSKALAILAEIRPQLMVTDLRMPGMGGMQLINEALEQQSGLGIVVLSGFGTIELAVQALQAGAYDFLSKPVEPGQLFRVIRKGLERARLLEENNRLRQIVIRRNSQDELVGAGKEMQGVRKTIAAIAQSEYTVLIKGESGTGKELAAKLIHRLGPRAEKPFMTVDCPSIPENLLESELFGYVRGAFTGADRDHKGLFVAADGGTLHLDEIGDIGLPVQAKLLRCLQSGEVRPLGANRAIKVDVRVIASTNRDLAAAMQERSFREDLFYRLNVLSLTMPPLRERLEDVPMLAMHMLRSACRESGETEKEMDAEVLQWLSRRPWPGNVRELQNIVRRLSVFCNENRIDMDLVAMVIPGHSEDIPQALHSGEGGPLPLDYKEAKAQVIDTFTRRYVKKLLSTTQGNISEAARISGLSRVALQKILSRLGVQADQYR
ncbi:MAG: sigma-54 dependent transcriptional regulator [bacterium]|nr:sigma-54 dependent transcriptional regulator [bacterium]